MIQPPRRRQEASRHVLGIKPRLEGMAGDRQILLPGRQAFAAGHAQLPFHQIDPGDRLGDRMFHLQAGVHFHEPEPVGAQAPAAVDDELDGPRTLVADRLGRPHGGRAHRLAHRGGHARRRGLLDHLLVAALERAVALEQMHRAGAIAKDLHLDMARLLDIFLDQYGWIAKGGARLALRAFEGGGEILRAGDLAHPLAAPACDGLDQHRIANLIRRTGQMFGILVFTMIAGHDGHPRLLHQPLGRVLEPHRPDRRRRRPDEHQPRRLDGIDEIGVLGQKAIAGVNALRARGLRGRDDPLAPQVAVGRRGAADMHGLIRHGDMLGRSIGIGIDGNRRHPQFAGGLDDPAGDFAAVGDEDFLEHVRPRLGNGDGRAGAFRAMALHPRTPGIFGSRRTAQTLLCLGRDAVQKGGGGQDVVDQPDGFAGNGCAVRRIALGLGQRPGRAGGSIGAQGPGIA